MAEPLTKIVRNKRTGEVRDLVSDDGGKSWRLDDTSVADMALDKRIAEAGPEDTTAIAPGGSLEENAPPPQQPAAEPPAAPQRAPMPLGEAIQTGQHNPFNMGDEASGFGAWLSSLAHGETPRTVGRGMSAPLDTRSEYRVAQQNEQAKQDQAQADHPWGYNLGKSSTEALATAPLGGIGAAPTLLETAAQNGLVGMGLGALSAGGASRADTPMGVVNDTAKGGLVGGGAGFALPIAAAGIKAGAGKLREGADYVRGMAAGGRALPKGESVAEYGRQVNELGLPGVLPRSVHGYEKAAGELGDESGASLGAMRESFDRGGARVHRDDILNSLNQIRKAYLAEGLDSSDLKAKVVADEIARVSAMKPGPMDIRDIQSSLEAQLAEQVPESEVARSMASGMPAALTGRSTPETQAGIRAAHEAVSAGNLDQVPEYMRTPEYTQAIENPSQGVQATADRASALRSRLEGGYKPGSNADPSQTAAAEAKRAAARAYSQVEDEAVGRAFPEQAQAHRALKDVYGGAREVQNNAAARAKTDRSMHIMTDIGLGMSGAATHGVKGGVGGVVASELAHRYGADTAAKLGYAGANTAGAVGSVMGAPGTSMVAATQAGQSIADKKAERSSDRAIDDPHYGSMISAAPAGEQRDVVYSQLLISDPDFRSRERERAAKLNEGGDD